MSSCVLSISTDGDSTTPLWNLFQNLTTLTAQKVGFSHSDGAPRASVCGRCLLSCHKHHGEEFGSFFLLITSYIREPRPGQSSSQQDVGIHLQLHTQMCPSPRLAAQRELYQPGLADQQRRNVSHLCFNGYSRHPGSHFSGRNRDTRVPREVHGIYGMHTKCVVYKEEICLPILYHRKIII